MHINVDVFRPPFTVANISGTEQAIDKRKMALSTNFVSRSMKTIRWTWPLFDLWPWSCRGTLLRKISWSLSAAVHELSW